MDVVKELSLPLYIEIGLAISTLVFGFIAGSYRQLLKFKCKQKKDKAMDWMIHSEIHELLTELRYETDAARAQLVQFHNGEYFMDGVSMKKLSLTHESLSVGVSAEADKLKGLLISLFTPLITKIVKDSPELIITKNEDDSFFKNFLLSSNAQAYLALPIKHENNICGYIMLQWCSPTKLKKASSNINEINERFTSVRNLIQIQLEEQRRIT